ncbi:MAG: EamA family transporter [Candidatus Onthovivens sp.]|nr:EamA family transporter [Candidatus Onthovivens sp.]
MDWLILSLVAAFCTSMTTILAKIGIKDVNSNFATLYRTFIVIICSIIICAIQNTFQATFSFTKENWIYLSFSGVATGLSWIFYYKAIKEGDVNKVAPIDKSSFILTSILFLIFFFDDTTKNGDPLTICMLVLAMVLMFVGTLLMITKKEEKKNIKSKKRLIYALLSAIFASIVSLLIKLGLKGIPSSIGTLYRTIIVLVFALIIVLIKKEYRGVKKISLKSLVFLTLSGICTGGAWLCEYAALNIPSVNPIAVSAISKLAILLTIIFSFFILKEKLTKKGLIGLLILLLGIGIIIGFSL